MARCELSGKSSVVKNLVSHSNIKTKSRAFSNIQSKKFFSSQLKSAFKFKIAVSVLRDIGKAGSFDTFIVRQKDSLLSKKALQIKKKILKKTRQTKKIGKKSKKIS